MEYIDANKLRSEVERIKETGCESPILVCDDILTFIDYLLEEEHLDVDKIKNEWWNKGYLKGRQDAHIPARELGLPKAFDFKLSDEDLERDAVSFCFDNGLNTTPYIAKTIAKHYYELGLENARKEEKQCQNK